MREAEEPDLKDGLAKVYIGNGEYVIDNPLRYPRKDDAGGLLPGISGGWAGGEIGLQAFTEGVNVSSGMALAVTHTCQKFELSKE